ncbi:MATE family efflux transporter [Rhizobium helianthi]|uniref:MATE family efflux transporter n=1 Tax=Rhizobium helianthi TaxID=1132695 RepID=A0ABW4M1Z3_9HYPH
MTTEEKQPLGFDVTNRLVLSIAVPMTLGYLTTPLLGLTDTAVAGRLGDPAALAGLAIGAIIFDLLFGSLSFFRTSTTGLVAQAFGRRDEREEYAVLLRALIGALGLGVIMLCLAPLIWRFAPPLMSDETDVVETTRTYFAIRVLSSPATFANFAILGYVLGRGEGLLGLKLQILLNGTNVFLTLLFGLWLDWGIAGIALGTGAAEVVAMVAGLLVIVHRMRNRQRPRRGELFDRAKLGALFRLNSDILIRSLVLNFSFALMARMGASQGAVTLAANAVLMNIFLVCSFFLDGLAGAAEQLVGRAVGAGYRPGFARALLLTGIWSLAMGTLLAALFLVIGSPLIHMLTTSSEVRDIADHYLPLAALTGVTGALAFQIDGVFIGATWSREMRNMMLLSLLGYIVCLAALVPAFGNYGLWISLNLFLAFRGGLLAILLPGKIKSTFGSPRR